MDLTDAQVLVAMRRLGLVAKDFEVSSVSELEALQERVRKAYRRAAVELHPDKTNGDRDKELQLIALGVVLEEVRGLQVRPPKKRKIKMSFRVRL